jgi:hypothetical protein
MAYSPPLYSTLANWNMKRRRKFGMRVSLLHDPNPSQALRGFMLKGSNVMPNNVLNDTSHLAEE